MRNLLETDVKERYIEFNLRFGGETGGKTIEEVNQVVEDLHEEADLWTKQFADALKLR